MREVDITNIIIRDCIKDAKWVRVPPLRLYFSFDMFAIKKESNENFNEVELAMLPALTALFGLRTHQMLYSRRPIRGEL
jgi:hypothetical protein